MTFKIPTNKKTLTKSQAYLLSLMLTFPPHPCCEYFTIQSLSVLRNLSSEISQIRSKTKLKSFINVLVYLCLSFKEKVIQLPVYELTFA